MIKLVFGIFLFLVTIFGGSYGLHTFGYGHWTHFPSFFSTLVGSISGVFLIFAGLADIDDQKNYKRKQKNGLEEGKT